MTKATISSLPATPISPGFAELLGRLEAGAARIGICGLGYVGLPLARALFERSHFHVIGFDTDSSKIRQLNSGRSYIRHIPSIAIADMIHAGRFEATDDFKRIAELDAVLICVPTPLGKNREPDLSFVVDTARAIAEHAGPDLLVILESTSYPGTMSEIVRPIFEERGLADGDAVFLAFSPEREDPGNSLYDTAKKP